MSATNLLRIHGRIELDQFWPDGKSDADTSKLVMRLTAPIEVRLAGTSEFVATRAYEDAVAPGGKPVIKDGRILVRLQRVDAPELHYKPDTRGSGGGLAGQGLVVDYRQHQAETATVELARYLRRFGADEVEVTFTSELKPSGGPGEAIDKYGRFVGDLLLPDGTNLNLWLLAQGLGIIALYESMLPHEIAESVQAARDGRGRGVVRHFSRRFVAFDPKLRVRPVGTAPSSEGSRRFIHPKFFRRQATWYAWHAADLFSGDFGDWLEHKAELVYHREEFLAEGRRAPKYALYERASDGNGAGWAPEEFIFLEAPSSITRQDERARSVKITEW